MGTEIFLGGKQDPEKNPISGTVWRVKVTSVYDASPSAFAHTPSGLLFPTSPKLAGLYPEPLGPLPLQNTHSCRFLDMSQ